jgi:hypothetical protein
MFMSKNLARASLAAMMLVVVAACEKQEAPVADTAPAEAPAVQVAAPGPADSGPVVISEYDAATPAAEGGHCQLDAINGGAPAGASAKPGSDIVFSGWVADAGNQVPAEARLVLKGAEKAYSAPLTAGVERPDVATTLAADTLKFSGYNLATKLDVAPGSYELSIVHGHAGSEASCTLNASLTVAN